MRQRLLYPLGLLLCLTSVARAGDFVDTRLNFTITDENVLAKPGETNPSVPGIHIGQPSSIGLLFFDNYDTRYTGYENLTHLVLYKNVNGYHLQAEGALVLRFLEFSDVSMSSLDDGSYIKVTYWLDPTREKKSNFAVVAFPMSADRMRLGYSYKISWGGSPIFFKFNPDLPQNQNGSSAAGTFAVNNSPAPGARLQFSNERIFAWAGFKTSLILNRNPNVNEQESVYGILGGVSVDVVKDHLRIEGNGGYFYRGTNQNLYSTQNPPDGIYTDYPVETVGASFQVSLFNGVSPSGSLDYALYKNDPTTATRYFAPYDYKPGFNWLIQSEFTYETTTLQDADNTASTTRQNGYAGDVNLRAQWGHARFHLDAVYRSLEFMLLNQPSLVPYQAFPKGAEVSGDKFIALGLDYKLSRIGLTLGPTLGVDFPASFTPPSGAGISQLCGNTAGTLCTAATIVVRGEGDYSILPEHDSMGQPISPSMVFAAKLQAREDFLDYFAVILDVYYTHDQNQTHLTKNPADGSYIRDFNQPAIDQLGFNFTLQARF